MILADTHVVIWRALEPGRISRKARAIIEQTRHQGRGIAISGVTLYEITVGESKGRIRLTSSLETFLAEIEKRFVVLPLTGRVCVLARGLPAVYPQDPADRIIAATALGEGAPLITADTEIHRSKALSTIW